MSAEHLRLKVTIDGFTESFWATPAGLNIAVIDNILINGAMSLGDTVRYNDDQQVTELITRANRVAITIGTDLEQDDPRQAQWQSTVRSAAEHLRRQGHAVELGFGCLLLSLEPRDPDLGRKASEHISEHDDEELAGVIDLFEGYHLSEVQFAIGPSGGDSCSAADLRLEIPAAEPVEHPTFTDEELQQIRDTFSDIDRMTDLRQRLIDAEALNPSVNLPDLITESHTQVIHGTQCAEAFRRGHLDQILVFSGRIIALREGLLIPPLEGYLFSTTFLNLPY